MIAILSSGDPRIPDRGSCVLGEVLRTRAEDAPDQVYAVFEDGEQWTYRETLERSLGTAAGLQALGVDHGHRVLSWLPNGPDALRVWFAANLAGATSVPINTAYRGAVLEHVVRSSGARVAVVHRRLVPRLVGCDLAALEAVVVVGSGDDQPPDLPVAAHPADTLDTPAARFAPPAEPVEPWDTQAIIYTSGTTGPSKGVLSSYVHHYTSCVAAFDGRIGPDERYLANLPLFHAGGTIGAFAMLLFGGSIALAEGFDTRSFWDFVRRTAVTSCTLLGVMASFLAKQEPRPDDRDNPLRMAFMLPLPEDAPAFADRFGLDVFTMFNMTETACPIVSERNPTRPGTCGKLRPGVSARLVDDHDREVAVGAVGELAVRTDRPWALNHGYDTMPEATARAWRNGWFHTGDAFRRDEDGYFYFVDRIKDAIRRRGENISSFEVEAEVLAHPGVLEAAAVAVPSEHGEDEVLVVVAPVPGHEVKPVELLDFLVPRMAHFMVPRYVRVLAELPKTPTNKVQKHRLRADGVTPDTWDRQAAGIAVKRERLR